MRFVAKTFDFGMIWDRIDNRIPGSRNGRRMLSGESGNRTQKEFRSAAATKRRVCMGDRMRPVPFEELVERIFSEYRNHGTIFGIHKEDFYKPSGKHSITVFGQKCATPLGPAA